MKLVFNDQYKSITPGGELELPRLVILTGLNGSGKTQLLSAIGSPAVPTKKIRVEIDGEELKSTRYLSSARLTPGRSERIEPSTGEDVYLLLLQWCDQSVSSGQGITEEEKYVNRVPSRYHEDCKRNSNYHKLKPVLKKLLQKSFDGGKRQVTKDEIRQLVSLEDLQQIDQSAMFQQAFSTTFLRYFQDFRANQISRYLRDQENEPVSALDDKDFYALKGRPPWELVNQMLERMDLPFEINKPVSSENAYSARLTSKLNGANIDFSELSSGEQSLCSLAIALYQSETDVAFPDVLLLDEPDAHLHPKMASKMIDTLQDVILPRLKGGVIVATHSPTTCALAPTGSLYLMDTETRRPKKTTLDAALETLCVGLPILSIRKSNEKQVIVESDVDAELYTQLWMKTKDVSSGEANAPTLNFLSSGAGYKTGSCDAAIDLCNKLRDAGSTTAFAIVDHDGHRKPSKAVKVLGSGLGYSIENFVLNPLSVVGLLYHRHGECDKIPDFAKGIDLVGLGSIGTEEQQEISTGFCASLRAFLEVNRQPGNTVNKFPKIDLSNDGPAELSLLDGTEIVLPHWFMHSQGHCIEDAIRAQYPELQKYGRNAGDLMQAAVRHVLASHSGLIPKGIVETLRQVQMS